MTRSKAVAQRAQELDEDALPGQVLAPCQSGRGRTFGPAVDAESTQPEQPGEPDAEPAGNDGGHD